MSARHAVTQAAQLGEPLFRTLLDSAPDAVVLTDWEGRVVLVNVQAERMFGHERDTLVGQDANRLLPARFHGLFLPPAVVSASPKPMAAEGLELTCLHADGREFPVEIRLSPVVGDTAGLRMGVIRDISQRQQASLELQNRARQEAAIAAFGRRAIGELDLAELVNQATNCVAATLSISYCVTMALADDQSALLCKAISFSASMPTAERTRFDRSQPEHLASLSGYAFRMGQPALYRRGDRDFVYDVSLLERLRIGSAAAVPVKFRDRGWGTLTVYSQAEHDFSIGEIHFLESIASMLSVALDRKQTEEALRRDRDFAESLIQTAQAIVLVLDPSGRILRFNPYTEELIGYPLVQARGVSWAAIALTPDGSEAGREFFRAVPNRTPLTTAIHPVVSRTGGQHHIQWTGRALTDANGAVTGLLFVGHDLTELHEAQKQLIESERLAVIGQMASGLAHESRNALQQIGACAEMLTMELHGHREALDLVEGVQEAQARLHSLFEDVRAYAVPLRLERRTTDLSQLWQTSWQHLTSQRRLTAARLVERREGVDLFCEIDAPSMQQALHNILENALDASGDDPQVEIRCREIDIDGHSALWVGFVDNGPGLGPEQQRRIFEPFFTTKTQGTGLGMTIARRVIEAHGGRLEASSAPLGGTEIRVILPRQA